MCGNSDIVEKNVAMGQSWTSENTEGEDSNGGESDCSFKGRRGKPPRVTHNKLYRSMLEGKAEKTKHAQEKLAKVKSKIQVEPRKQPQ